jgi:hypothetical protein
MLANQGLYLAHAHEHNGGEPEGHDSRPHFHLGGHVHHQDSHERESHELDNHSRSDDQSAPSNSDEHLPASTCNCPPLGDHDSDAVYGSELVTLAHTGNSANILPDKDVVAGLASLQLEGQIDGRLHCQPSRDQSSFLCDVGHPIYLRTLSLRL